jgi:hypothetical protein
VAEDDHSLDSVTKICTVEEVTVCDNEVGAKVGTARNFSKQRSAKRSCDSLGFWPRGVPCNHDGSGFVVQSEALSTRSFRLTRHLISVSVAREKVFGPRAREGVGEGKIDVNRTGARRALCGIQDLCCEVNGGFALTRRSGWGVDVEGVAGCLTKYARLDRGLIRSNSTEFGWAISRDDDEWHSRVVSLEHGRMQVSHGCTGGDNHHDGTLFFNR